MNHPVPYDSNQQNMDVALRETGGQHAVLTRQSVEDVIKHVNFVHEIMKRLLREGEHYGVMPGMEGRKDDRKVLFKSGAEKLALAFRLRPTFQIERHELPNGHREYEVVCTLNGLYQGVGFCSSMEAKYRFRTGPKTFTDELVPRTYWDLKDREAKRAQELLGGPGRVPGKNEQGVWVVCLRGQRVENDSIADTFNTILKMAKKRAFVDAVITATSTSDIFTQDVVEEPEEGAPGAESRQAPPPSRPRPAPQPAAQPAIDVEQVDNGRPKMPTDDDMSFENAVPAEAPGDMDPPKETSSTPWYAQHPEYDPQDKGWWKKAIWPIPPKGVRKADYMKDPKTLGELATKDSNWFYGQAHNYTPRPYQGKIQDEDLLLRMALDAACDAHEKWTKPQWNPNP